MFKEILNYDFVSDYFLELIRTMGENIVSGPAVVGKANYNSINIKLHTAIRCTSSNAFINISSSAPPGGAAGIK